MPNREVYVSTDIEADGPIPGPHSMLAMASAAFTADGAPAGTFTANLELLPGAAGDPRTMAWWKTQPAAWEACRAGARPPADVMRDAIREVEEALVTLRSAADRSENAQEAATQYRVALTAAEDRYHAGLGSLFELEEARRTFLEAQIAVIQLERERVAAWISLYRALGGGWSPQSAELST